MEQLVGNIPMVSWPFATLETGSSTHSTGSWAVCSCPLTTSSSWV